MSRLRLHSYLRRSSQDDACHIGVVRFVARLGAVFVVIALGAPAAARAAPSWLAPIDVSAGGESAVSPDVALDAQGNAVAVWQRFNGTVTVVHAAVRQCPALPAPASRTGPGFGSGWTSVLPSERRSALPAVSADPRGRLRPRVPNPAHCRLH